MVSLSKNEQALIDGNHSFSLTKQRYLRYRIKKKYGVATVRGLAIPRPTRLGDPRSVCASLSNIILTSLSSFLLLL